MLNKAIIKQAEDASRLATDAGIHLERAEEAFEKGHYEEQTRHLDEATRCNSLAFCDALDVCDAIVAAAKVRA